MSEENNTEQGAEAPAKKAAPRKRTPAASKAADAKPAAAKKAPAKKAAPKKPAAKKPAPKAEAAPAAERTEPPAPEMAAADLDAHEEAASTQEETRSSTDEFIAELKEKDWAGYLLRGVFMLLFGFLSWVAISICFLLAGVQFVILVLTGGPNETITKGIMIGGNYIADVMAYLSFKTDERPFPLGKELRLDD